MIDKILWLGHGSFLIQAPPIIYIDPWRVVRSVFHADIILISHDHYDHFSIADIDKLKGPETQIITNDRVAQQLPGATVLRPWQTMTIDNVGIKAIPAYSTKNQLQHPQSHGGLGFVISHGLYDIYYAGDTMQIPEMNYIHPDIAILPIDGNGTLEVEDAVEVIKLLKPRWTFPCNWGATGEGTNRSDAIRFKRLASDYTDVVVKEDN